MRRRLLLAVSVAAALVLSGPYIGLLRSTLKRTFPGRFGLIVNTTIALAIGGAIITALARVREQRMARYGALAVAAVLGVTYAHFFIHGSSETVTVERFHFVEYGLITFLFYRVWRTRADLSTFLLPALAGLFVGTLDEGLQFFVPDRIGELNDLQLNAAAIACGLLFSWGVDPPVPGDRLWHRGSPMRVGVAAALTASAMAIFIASVHLGHTVQDPEIGSFASRYDAGELRQFARERETSGFTVPGRAPRFSREDQYLTEALWHVQQRNELWATNMAASWSENLILERYFSPALDLGHRWPAPQREAASARAPRPPGGFVSTANRLAIYTWNRAVFWGISGAIVGLCLLVALAAERAKILV